MTTLVSLPTRNCIVLGCDSLATSSLPLISPHALLEELFDENNNFKTDGNGNPVIPNANDVLGLAENKPVNQMPNMTKIFNLRPADVGLLVAGIANIGNKTIQNIVHEFSDEPDIKSYLKRTYTISGICKRLFNYIKNLYDKEYTEPYYKPILEIIISGYSTKRYTPEIFKLKFGATHKNEKQLENTNDLKIIFGGQHDVISRVVRGIDLNGFISLISGSSKMLNKYRDLLHSFLQKNGVTLELPKPNEYNDELLISKFMHFSGVSSSVSNFSEQAAIDFVDFLVEIMIKSQEFSNELPTVGGDIHVAIIKKSHGFKWISKEVYNYKNNEVAKHE